MSTFTVRPASLATNDDAFLLECFDSQIKWLPSVGAGDQWGSEPVSGEPDTQNRYRKYVQTSQDGERQPWGEDSCRVYIAEANDQNGKAVPVAGLILTAKASDYVQSTIPAQDPTDPFIYMPLLISDREKGSLSKGAGVTLIEFAKKELVMLGFKRLCCDCWSGNERRLVQFYESKGFKALASFTHDGWPGQVLELRLE
ncbi:putative GCN5 family acetyltransferase [Acrodontium crateriforme]|uniref:GCN5 family acetyltransferase n=1 Tax=Acrodontium crateriforme TaxID=150365 RepID=A0AAQ3LZ19_9PEZI|nr:putative GCN5 family acetyltransferase [Acrodontium crateriforme]